MKTKTENNTFPVAQFLVNHISEQYRLDRNSNWEWVMIYIRKDIPSKLLDKHPRPFDIEGRFGELSFRKCKWLLFGT